jgi:hypothetical protein
MAGLGGRVYALGIPADATLPAAAYQLVASEPIRSLNGVEMVRRQWRITIHAEQIAQARQLAEQVRAALEGWSARAGGIEIARVEDIGESLVDFGDGQAVAVSLSVVVTEV